MYKVFSEQFLKKALSSVVALLLAMPGMLAQETIKISHGPYLQAMTDSSVIIVWTSTKPSVGWVELAPDDGSNFYQTERPKYFNADNGLKNITTVHRVKLEDLKPHTRYRYRVYSQEVLSHEWVNVQYGKTAATVVYGRKPLSFTTSGKPGGFEFAVINDMHERNPVMKQLLGQVDMAATDFIVFNGDMVSSSMSEAQIFSGFMDTAVVLFASEKPMYYARGNHETRAPFASQFSNYFPTTSGQLYYMFTKGDACFIVLDAGEDKPDSDIEYSGITDMDFYRTRQAKWLQGIVKTEAFTKARFKIAICHIPAVNGWHGNEEIINKWAPILNDAGIHIMLSGHEHRHRFVPPNPVVKFPVLVNSNNHIIKAKISNQEARFTVFDTTGKKVDERVVR